MAFFIVLFRAIICLVTSSEGRPRKTRKVSLLVLSSFFQPILTKCMPLVANQERVEDSGGGSHGGGSSANQGSTSANRAALGVSLGEISTQARLKVASY